MSALGQKQTFAMQKRMSALPPIADIDRDIRLPYAGSKARSSTRKLGTRLSRRSRALADRFAKSRDGGFDHSVLSWAAPLRQRGPKLFR
jgi:hypothetical protein